MTHLRAAFYAALLSTVGAASVMAAEVTLGSRDGALKVTGEYLGFDGEFYRLKTAYGTLTFDGAGIICEGAACPDLANYVAEATFSGARALGETLLPALIETFATRSGLRIARLVTDDLTFTYELSERDGQQVVGRFAFRLGNSDQGFTDLIAERADIALSLREVTPEENAAAKATAVGDLALRGRSRILGLDALVPLISVSNPLREIGLSDLRGIFSGRIKSWKVLGGADEPIILHLRDENAGQTQAFMRRVMGRTTAKLAPGIVRHESDAGLADAVASDPRALGIGSFSEIGNAVALPLAGPCGVTSSASETTLKTEDYPLTTPFFAYQPARRLPPLVRQFLAYVNSPAAQPVIRRAGFVDQFPESIPLRAQGDRFANAILRAGNETSLAELQRMVTALKDMARLTITFRFEDGSATLDPQSRSNVVLLADALERGVFQDRRLVFVGFSDGQGSAGTNRRLSRDRARTVRDAVREAAHQLNPSAQKLEIEAFGEALPMACDETDWGRGVNRRVEIWLR